MNNEFRQKYGNHLLKCIPDSTPDGKFFSRLVIWFPANGGYKDFETTFDQPFATATEAANHAFDEGKRWINAHGC